MGDEKRTCKNNTRNSEYNHNYSTKQAQISREVDALGELSGGLRRFHFLVLMNESPIDDLVDIFPLAFVHRTIGEKILNNRYLWNDDITLDLSAFTNSDRLFKYLNRMNHSLSDENLFTYAEREKLKITIDFLEALGLAEHIKKLKTFPSVTNLVYCSSFNKGNRYEPLNISNQSAWKNLEHVSVYFDSDALMSFIKTHNTISSFSFSPKFSDSNFLKTLTTDLSLLRNIQTIDIDFKFDLDQIEKSPLLPKFQSLIVDPVKELKETFIETTFTHLTKLALENTQTGSLTLKNLTFPNLKELNISYPSSTMNTVHVENLIIPNLEKITLQCICMNTSGKNHFPSLKSLNFFHCKYDSSFWIDIQRSLTTIILYDIESGVISSSNRQVMIDGHPSVEVVFCGSLEDVSIFDCPSLKKVYIERCKTCTLCNKHFHTVSIPRCEENGQIFIECDYCGKLILPKEAELVTIDVKTISVLNCYYSSDLSRFIPKNSHNMTLDWLAEHTYIIEKQQVKPTEIDSKPSKLLHLATKIVTHSQEFELGYTLKKYQNLQSLTSPSQLNFYNHSYTSYSLTHLEALILTSSKEIDINMDRFSSSLEELSITSSTDVKIIGQTTMTHLKFFYLENVKNLHIYIRLSAPKLREVIVHSIRSFDSNNNRREPTLQIIHAPKLLFNYVSFGCSSQNTTTTTPPDSNLPPNTAMDAPYNYRCSVLRFPFAHI
ncbi:hypothetical protein FDP41_012872 [Naegleria fowleri]|uniref:Uncharacterized protein n=1 Tax=Naegleria fowleri TaxID=5763 RepID=A0A6A5C3K1_NAEFO|nr:uncharacterized protein FDP41_012872 [Naegleria fowleri]KAF0981084.1 hypothetical protein FDP41_012872 [Naegleria fowleri]